ncbi:MAG: preprotein translocase subunit SecG [Deltaproteobacteria bacterium GWC2_42_51]|nr:MAG: preprotein translocase subunit SecG [Deltaproteobacteria bacterium GWC2_42_51]OGP42257.1 MAG: preprotein translocase subunit SecG [Deltaproteobacteria bacterium GWD2_42_10]OGQ27488.1 MAG: preprotein translocase subunit SecG [Deltaproteobacteria bacterium RIFCSPHIGHO2_02_FULL_42_44]OGQ38293.1 MAG: preprotein translocase subunit SecG [Deltaproteobacteria bacterium RIFCSPLOWO2_02_FULL_42_39]OGQ67067.1 MAG: preprotein translocase subunit SecG [Deltaproteobacteria bacterium RIFCSPLOWO2_12_FU
MHTAIIILHVLVSVFLIIVILLQAGKGASIGASFGGSSSQTLFGSSGPATFLSKLTVGCAAIFMITSMYLTYMAASKATGTIMKDVPAAKQETQPTEQKPAEPAASPQETTGTATK